jgi:hypothetical protein
MGVDLAFPEFEIQPVGEDAADEGCHLIVLRLTAKGQLREKHRFEDGCGFISGKFPDLLQVDQRHQGAAMIRGLLELFLHFFPVDSYCIAAFGDMEHPGERQVDLAAGLIDQPQPFVLGLGDKGADKLAVVQIFDEFSRYGHERL